MATDDLFLRRAVVVGSGALYWVGVFVQVRRIRRRIGRSPNVKPRGLKEDLLWFGWFLVIAVWIGQPFVAGSEASPGWMRPLASWLNRLELACGISLLAAGYAGTLWCYAIMGDAWRMGINRREKSPLVTQGPYRVVRHPIYLFQIVMLAGAALLLPTLPSLLALLIHLGCALIKASDEENYLLSVHGDVYRDYLSRTGRLLPKRQGIRTHTT